MTSLGEGQRNSLDEMLRAREAKQLSLVQGSCLNNQHRTWIHLSKEKHFEILRSRPWHPSLTLASTPNHKDSPGRTTRETETQCFLYNQEGLISIIGSFCARARKSIKCLSWKLGSAGEREGKKATSLPTSWSVWITAQSDFQVYNLSFLWPLG